MICIIFIILSYIYHTSALIGSGIPVSSPPDEYDVMPQTSVELHLLQKKRPTVSKAKKKRPTEVGKDQIIEKLMIFTNSHSIFDKDKVSRKCRLSLFKISF